MENKQYQNYIKILQGELLPAMGCTEPIAIAYAAAKAKAVLGNMPEKMLVRCSGNIIKNVKGVVVPNSGGQKGVAAAAVLGMVAGDAALELEVISNVSSEQIEKARDLCQQGICICELEQYEENLFIHVQMQYKNDEVIVEVRGKHNHIAKIVKNDEVLFQQDDILAEKIGNKNKLNINEIIEFANIVNIADITAIIGKQVEYNSAISFEGLKHAWGAQVGRTLMMHSGDDVRIKAKAAAAAGSDARMNGCALPVVINSGSGNQGIACAMPVIIYAQQLNATEEQLYRALVLTNLLAIHQKRYIGNLSAYCGAVSAGAAAACGIAYLYGADTDTISKTLINALGNVAGIVCDGAKDSCAAKIASAVDAGIMGYEMAKQGLAFPFGEGVIEENYEKSIRNIGRIGKYGMKSTDVEILNIMLGH